ncbi:hypothetical protein [Caulobacter sp. X]|uniref:hypothetical protein n=1 Tax=Caulobacter sp. X TaxID=2048901 RepID=UPI000C156BC7|nr:hypothetical protein [Caulobacter sp. X]PIC01509.1 hypothetical protein CSW60_08440 [Caulobacter sp. X]
MFIVPVESVLVSHRNICEPHLKNPQLVFSVDPALLGATKPPPPDACQLLNSDALKAHNGAALSELLT